MNCDEKGNLSGYVSVILPEIDAKRHNLGF